MCTSGVDPYLCNGYIPYSTPPVLVPLPEPLSQGGINEHMPAPPWPTGSPTFQTDTHVHTCTFLPAISPPPGITHIPKGLRLSLNTHWMGTSLVVQWLRLHAPNAGGPDSIPGQGTRSHMAQLRVCMPQLKIPRATTKIPHVATKVSRAATKTQSNQINE